MTFTFRGLSVADMYAPSNALKFEIFIDHATFRAVADEIGSKEYPRWCQVALDKTARWATDRMRQIMPEILGEDLKGARAKWARPAGVSHYTRQGIQHVLTKNTLKENYNTIKDVDELSTAIVINKSQSVYLKYAFGDGMQTRRAGDAGLAEDRILIPNVGNLLQTQGLSANSFFVGSSKSPSDLMKVIHQRVALGKISATPWRKAMSEMAQTSRAMHNHNNPFDMQTRLKAELDKKGASLKDVLSGSNQRTASLMRTVKRYAEKTFKNSPTWTLYKGKDPKSRLDTYFSRPMRMRDPSNGTHEFTRRDGSKATMPDMINVYPQWGRAGKSLGPARLFTAVDHADYKPKLEKPWDDNAALANEYFAVFFMEEYERKLVRKAEGRKF